MALRPGPGSNNTELRNPLEEEEDFDFLEDEDDFEEAKLAGLEDEIELKAVRPISIITTDDGEYIQKHPGNASEQPDSSPADSDRKATPPQEPEFSLVRLIPTPQGHHLFQVDNAPNVDEMTPDEIGPGELEGIRLDNLRFRENQLDGWMTLLSSNIPQAENGEAVSKRVRYLKKTLIATASAVTPAAFALNAFVGLTGIKLENLSLEAYQALDVDKQILAWLCGCSSELINFLSNMDNIPKAFECLANLKNNFGANPGRNALILLLTSGAAIASGAIGFSSFAWAGTGIAALNGGTNIFLTFVTRFYGLINLSKRFDHYREQGKFEELLERLSTDDTLLNELANSYTHELNDILNKEEKGEPIDRETIFDLLNTLFLMLKNDPDLKLKEKSASDKFFTALNWSFATLAALSVAPIFAQKFLDGMSKIGLAHTIDEGNIHLKRIAGLVLGSATPLAYLNACSQLAPTLGDAFAALKSGTTPCWRKAFSPFVLMANVAASVSGYNLAKDVAAKPGYIFKDLTPPDSTADITARVVATIATAGTNGPFAVRTILPAPKHEEKISATARLHAADLQKRNQPTNIPPSDLDHSESKAELKAPLTSRSNKPSTANLLKALATDSAKLLKKMPLTKEGVAELNKSRKETAQARAKSNVTSDSSRDLLALVVEDPHDAYFNDAAPPGSNLSLFPRHTHRTLGVSLAPLRNTSTSSSSSSSTASTPSPTRS